MSTNKENIERLEEALLRIKNKENIIYFLVYDTGDNARAGVKYIYDMCLVLNENGYVSKLIVEDEKYTGVESWLGEKYKSLEILNIKNDKIELDIDDVIVIPEYYSNALPQLNEVKSVKVMLIQQKDLMFETLSIGSRWSDFGFDKCITTTEKSKEHIKDIFPETLIHVNPPFIGDNFEKPDIPNKPYIAISVRDRVKHRRLISEFYLRYPQLRWITFRDMVQMSYEEFSEALKECFVSVWVDEDTTFGTFPLESMKTGVPVIGLIPNVEPDWLDENGMWTYDVSKVVEILGTFILGNLEGKSKVSNEFNKKMNETVNIYTKENFTNKTISIFDSLINNRLENIKETIDKLNEKSEE